MLDFLVLMFSIILVISLLVLLTAYRSRPRDDKPVYYTAENTAADETEGHDEPA